MIKYIKFTALALLAVLSFTSCNKEEEKSVFGKPAAERIKEQEQEVKNLLINSEYGWKFTYFTDDSRFTPEDQQLGGWTFVAKFNENNEVTMVSDFDRSTVTEKTSAYNVLMGSTVALQFSTKNYISLLSDSDNFPSSDLRGKGYRGDFEFLYYGKDGDDLLFRSNRYNIPIRFTKATADDWNLTPNFETEQKLINSISVIPSDTKLIIRKANEESSNNVLFSPAKRFVKGETGSDIAFGVAYAKDMLKVAPPIRVGDNETDVLVYDAGEKAFIRNFENGDFVKLKLSTANLNLHNIFANYSGFFLFDPLDNRPTSSTPFLEKLVEVKNVINQNNSDHQFLGFIFSVSGNNVQVQYMIYDSNSDSFIRKTKTGTITIDNATSTLKLTSGTWHGGSNYTTELKPVDDILFNAQGLLMANTGNTFRLWGAENPVITFTSLENTEERIGGFLRRN